MSLIAREHDVNANLVFRWRQQYQEGLFGPISQSATTFFPVQVIEAPSDLSQTVQPQGDCSVGCSKTMCGDFVLVPHTLQCFE